MCIYTAYQCYGCGTHFGVIREHCSFDERNDNRPVRTAILAAEGQTYPGTGITSHACGPDADCPSDCPARPAVPVEILLNYDEETQTRVEATPAGQALYAVVKECLGFSGRFSTTGLQAGMVDGNAAEGGEGGEGGESVLRRTCGRCKGREVKVV